MQENTATKPVWGLSLAAIILAALAIVGCLLTFAASATLPGIIGTVVSTDALPTAVANGIGNTKDAAELKAAVDSLNDPKLQPISELLDATVKGNVREILSQVNIGDPQKLQKLADAFASLSDQQINEIAAQVHHVSAADLREARDTAARVTPAEIERLSTALRGASTQDLIIGSVGLATATIFMLVGWVLLCSVISLIAGILGVKNAKRPEKLGAAFAWSIVGAVTALFSARIATMVILIIDAVYINKARNFLER